MPWVRSFSVVVVAAVVASVGGAVAVAAPARVAAGAVQTAAARPAQRVSEAPDLVSARVAARAQGSRVEALSERTESTTTWVNPNGSLTTTASWAPVRVKDAAGQWQPVDLSLVGRGTGVAPRASAAPFTLSGGGAGDLVSADHGGGRGVSWALPGGHLPKPVVSGDTATYAGVAPGVDVRVSSRPSGFEQDFVIADRAAADATKGSFTVGLHTKGLTAKAQPDGSIDFVDAKGKSVSRIPAAMAFDASVDPRSGEPAHAPVTLSVAQQNPGRAELTVSVDRSWLDDPSRVFPVRVDPSYVTVKSYPSFDTFVETGWTTDQSSATELKVGTYDGGTTKARSFLSFPNKWQWSHVESATLSLYETWSYSCSAREVDVHRANGASTATRWTSQPSIDATVQGRVTIAKGFSSSCSPGWINIGVTSMAQYWSDQGWSVGAIALQAANESDSYGWKKFSSSEGNYWPTMTVTYDRIPNVSSAPTLASPPATSWGGTVYTRDLTPTFSTSASDPDGNTVQHTVQVWTTTTPAAGATPAATCVTPWTASGATGSCTPTTALADNTTYYARVAVEDDQGMWNSTWSPWTTFKTAAATPPVPMLSCPTPYTNGSWATSAPTAPVSCTVTGAGSGNSAPAWIHYILDGGTEQRVPITRSSDPSVAKSTVSVPNTNGAHQIRAWTEAPSGTVSAVASYGFGYGTAGLTAPKADPSVTGAATVSAAGPPAAGAAVTPVLKWRVAGSGQDASTGWNTSSTTLVQTRNDSSGVAFSGAWDTSTATQDAYLDSDPATAGVQPTTLNPRVPVRLEVQVCLTYSTSGTQCTWADPSSHATLTRVPHAFGNGFPTDAAGPGQVALFTGEFTTAATDVSVPGYTGALSLGRSHATYANNTASATTGAQGVFGPGWTASLQGSDAGLAGSTLVDSTALDGTIAMVGDDGSAMIFAAPSGRRTGPSLEAGTYTPVDDDARTSGVKLAVSGTGAATTVTLTEDDATVTTFTAATGAPDVAKAAVLTPTGVSVPNAGATSYSYDTAGRVTRILAPIPAGMTSGDCPYGPASGLKPGCRALALTYATSTGGTSVTGQLARVDLQIYNPDAGLRVTDCAGATSTPGKGMVSVPVACYGYDTTSKRLISVKDPRSGLATGYEYGTDNQLTSLTPPGQSAYQFGYTTAEGRLKLTSVTRQAPSGATANLTRVVYDAPRSGTGLPDLSAGAVARWGQQAAPTYAAAVFGPDYTGPMPGGGTVDWTYADFSYTDAQGYTTNTAGYGAGTWLFTRADHDTRGNTVFTLDAAAIDRILAAGGVPDVTPYGTTTVYNTSDTGASPPAGLPANTSAGSVVTDTYAPARTALLPDGSTGLVRPHTHLDYDQGAPNSGTDPKTGIGYALATTSTTTADSAAANGPTDLRGPVLSRTFTGYADAAGSADSNTSGWALRTPTTTTTDLNLSGTIDAGDITTSTSYTSEGRTASTRQPASSGTDAGTTNTIYYTALANPADPTCGNKPEWAGLACTTTRAGQPAGTSLPDTRITGYSYLLAPTSEVETSGAGASAVTRTTGTTYLPDGRLDTTGQVVTAPAGSGIGTPDTARPAVRTLYDAAQGAAVGAAAVDGTQTATSLIDGWGRTTSYTSSQGDTTNTAYDAAGRVATVTDPKGTVTYSYDGTDAAGVTERRGLPTKLVVSRGAGQGSLTFTGAYNAAGALTRQDLPGQLSMNVTFDEVGQPAGLSYTGQVTPVTESTNPDGSITYTPGAPGRGVWFGWTHARDALGRVVRDWTGQGAGFDGTPGVTDPSSITAPAVARADGSDRVYGYDPAGRLTRVADRTAAVTGSLVSPDTPATAAVPCTVRGYAFDANGNRTKLVTDTHGDGVCTGTPTATTTSTYAYDSADRATTGANGTGTYGYDPLGRVRTLPAVDAPDPAKGDITLGYYDNDLARTITQAGQTTTYGLDVTGRRTVAATGPTGGGAATQTLVRHYGDGSDNPAWTDTTTSAGTTTTRYAEDLTGNLGAEIGADGSATLAIANVHGDVVTTVAIPAGQPESAAATSCGGWSDYTEYGTPRDPAATSAVAGTIGYGWLGAKQRSTTIEAAGLTLMGVRLYNPARGQFTSLDPVAGGNTTAYIYPQDPVNGYDLTGQCWGWGCQWIADHAKSAWQWAKTNRHAIARHVVGMAATTLAVAGAAAVCGATGGVGCVVIVGAMWGAATNVIGQGYLSTRWHERVTATTAFGWVASGAFGGATGGYARTLPRRGVWLPSHIKIAVHHAPHLSRFVRRMWDW